MKPEWKDAHEWANYLAMDGDGRWFWYEREPEISEVIGYFYAERGGKYQEANEVFSEWKESLERRP